MLPTHSRCILGLEDDRNTAERPGGQRRQRRRGNGSTSAVEGLRPLFQEFMGQPAPQQQNTFNVPVCIQLLGVLPAGHPLVSRIHSRVEEFFDADLARGRDARSAPLRRSRDALDESD